ncbi:ATP-binding cassette domain-containing protein [Monashia sp. NPDC004114]
MPALDGRAGRDRGAAHRPPRSRARRRDSRPRRGTDRGRRAEPCVADGVISTSSPSLTAAENIGLPLELDGWSVRRARGQGLDALEQLRLRDLADRYPDQMSGGQQQRVAIARALGQSESAPLLGTLGGVGATRRSRRAMAASQAVYLSPIGAVVGVARFPSWPGSLPGCRSGVPPW